MRSIVRSAHPEETPEARRQPLRADAQRALDEMLANGARFSIPRPAEPEHFIYEVPVGAHRERCRAIIRDVKDRGLLHAFVSLVAGLAEGHA